MTLEALRAFLFGVAVAAPVGPIALLLIHIGHGSLWLFLGSLAVQASYASFGVVLRRWVATPGAVRRINAISGVVIAAFGVAGIASAFAR